MLLFGSTCVKEKPIPYLCLTKGETQTPKAAGTAVCRRHTVASGLKERRSPQSHCFDGIFNKFVFIHVTERSNVLRIGKT
jgi:hypothetical protein